MVRAARARPARGAPQGRRPVRVRARRRGGAGPRAAGRRLRGRARRHRARWPRPRWRASRSRIAACRRASSWSPATPRRPTARCWSRWRRTPSPSSCSWAWARAAPSRRACSRAGWPAATPAAIVLGGVDGADATPGSGTLAALGAAPLARTSDAPGTLVVGAVVIAGRGPRPERGRRGPRRPRAVPR